MPRFVLLRHHCPPDYEKPSHWDFMLEADGKLRTWDLRELPSAWADALENSRDSTNRRSKKTANKKAANQVTARPLPDHRLAYLDYEGPLTNNRGHVTQCDAGSYRTIAKTSEILTVVLEGQQLQGVIKLARESSAWSLEVVNEA